MTDTGERAYRAGGRGGCGRERGLARTLPLPARVVADSRPHAPLAQIVRANSNNSNTWKEHARQNRCARVPLSRSRPGRHGRQPATPTHRPHSASGPSVAIRGETPSRLAAHTEFRPYLGYGTADRTHEVYQKSRISRAPSANRAAVNGLASADSLPRPNGACCSQMKIRSTCALLAATNFSASSSQSRSTRGGLPTSGATSSRVMARSTY